MGSIPIPATLRLDSVQADIKKPPLLVVFVYVAELGVEPSL